ncbi:MAG: diaminopimelate decarboxylase, partial [Candidatus Angelobacter sp.]
MLETRGNELFVGGISVVDLVNKHSEPVYIYDAEVIEERCRLLRSLLPVDVGVLYSLKANPNPSVVAFLKDLVYGADVSSLAELHTALKASFVSGRIFFVGPSKSREELTEALQCGACVIVESEQELRMLDEIAGVLLVLSLTVVVLLAKSLAPFIETGIAAVGAPVRLAGVVVA